ncbi:bifunctional 5'-methylthioadenosine/S-adenosylhomocysteine nucleosidase/phosphatase [Bacillus sp. THAF10]|uniref:HAD family hydrolase n=1 Tax=Bacillus sp. THAF10 TaxID=2587848 RepID=UPI0012684992|nr:HAD family hydrolase [Bacillus sp. THAF10]QFT89580.1 bifunctional 5'-methylthioadenosine/S-adenosylhomocysteine nucleosidase/phosphatase [Bacillus sp. THAF10]
MDSIIFDLDGTLWDSRETVLVAWNKILKNHKQVDRELTSEDFKATMGLQMPEIGKRFFPDLDESTRNQLLNECGSAEQVLLEAKGGQLYDGVEEVLKSLSEKYKLFIVSNCQEGYIEAFYKYHQLDKHFIDFENPGRTGLSKGENIKLVIERNQLKSPVYVGDTLGDQEAAKAAGIPFVYACYGFGEASEYDYKIKKLEDLLIIF